MQVFQSPNHKQRSTQIHGRTGRKSLKIYVIQDTPRRYLKNDRAFLHSQHLEQSGTYERWEALKAAGKSIRFFYKLSGLGWNMGYFLVSTQTLK